MFVQATKSRKNGKTYTSHLVRESFRTNLWRTATLRLRFVRKILNAG